VDRMRLSPVLDRRIDRGMALTALRPSLEASWALACGCIASGLLRWEGSNGLRIVAAWLIGDAICGCILAQMVSLKRASLASDASVGTPGVTSSILRVPYAVPGSPGQRLADWANTQIAQWPLRTWPGAGRCGVTALVGVGLALVVATYLGRTVTAVLSAGLLVVALLVVIAGKDEAALSCWFAGLHVALAWSLGHLVLAPWRGPSMALAILAGLHAYARLRRDRSHERPALWFLGAIWSILVAVLLSARQPVLAALVAMAAGVELMSGAPWRAGQVAPMRQPGRLGWLLMTLCVALAATYWV